MEDDGDGDGSGEEDDGWMVDDYIYKHKALLLFNIKVATAILYARAIYSYYFCTGLAS
jgi:hypothetical protein